MSANMFSQRMLQTTMRRFAAAKSNTSQMQRMSPMAIATGQIRPQTSTANVQNMTRPTTPTEATDLLAAQRRHRPVSPHLTIYKPQITWIPSIMNRITGSILSGGLYVFGFAYLVAPAFGWHLESASMAAAFAAWPIAAKIFTKFFLSWQFTFHSFNGIRHLVWDTGSAFTNKQVIVTGWVTVGISLVTALGLTFY